MPADNPSTPPDDGNMRVSVTLPQSVVDKVRSQMYAGESFANAVRRKIIDGIEGAKGPVRP